MIDIEAIRKRNDVLRWEVASGDWAPHPLATPFSSLEETVSDIDALLAEVERLNELMLCPSCNTPEMWLGGYRGCRTCGDAF